MRTLVYDGCLMRADCAFRDPAGNLIRIQELR
jgi:hypothetical protein